MFCRFFRLSALLLASILFAVNTQAVPTIEDYAQLPATSLMSISPSGDIVAFRRVANGQDALMVISLKDGKTLRMLDASEVNPHQLYFLTDNDLVFIASEHRRVAGFKSAFEVSTAFRLKIDSGKIEQLLTPGKKIYPGQTGLGSIIGVSPDGKSVYMPAFVSRDGNKGNSGQVVSASRSANPNYSLMQVNIDKPTKLKSILKGTANNIDYFVGRNGEVLAQERYSDAANKHQILVPDGRSWKPIYEKATEIIGISVVAISHDEKHLVLLDESADNDRTGYFLMSLADGSISDTPYGRSDKDIEAVIVDKNRIAIGIRYSGFSPSYHFFDKATDEFVKSVINMAQDHSVWLTDWSEDFQKIIVRIEGSSYAGDYYLFDRAMQADFLSKRRPNISDEDINPIGKITYSAADGLKIPTLVTIPKQHLSELKNLPAVMLPHGGPESYDRLRFDWIAQAFASQGYLVIQPQFRGSAGFGGDHVRAGDGEWGKKMQSDISDGVAFFAKKGMIDPERVCIVGWSYGGYAALAGGAFTPDLYKCVVSINGVSDLPLIMRDEKADHGRDSWVVSYWEKLMTGGEASNENLKAVSPVHSADQFKAPVLLIHGERDQVVKINQSKRMKSALEKAGMPVELLILDDDNHSILEGDNRVKAFTKVIEFVNKNLLL
jgi:dipeptidyl aminopeptidase/acylaminoacyl peptidase